MNLKKSIKSSFAVMVLGAMVSVFVMPATPSFADDRPHGLEPADDMPYFPDLGGLRKKTFKNQNGQVRHLAESVVLRRSIIADSKATIPAGGFYYISETTEDARPFMRDPFFLLGEHAYLVDLKTTTREVNDIYIKRGEKILVDDSGYRLWFDYATDHYDLPYIQLALISPAGHWPLEFPISTKFPEMTEALTMNLLDPEQEDAHIGQIEEFFLDPVYQYGASRFVATNTDFTEASFKSLIYPVIEEATFSMSRPYVLDLRQEGYRIYKTKRIYASREPNGFKVTVTDLMGSNVLAEKVITPVTPQGYKDRDDVKDAYFLTIPEEDMRIEIHLNPEYLANSDFTPFSTDVPFGYAQGILSFVIYEDLITLKNGDAWQLDPNYKVGLEANLLTGKLQRVVFENAAPITLTNDNNVIEGPIKYSHIWNRPAFKFVAEGFKDSVVSEYYVRDQFFQRTENMVFDEKKGRKDVDFFVGRAPTFISILEDTFLTRLADPTYGTVVQGSHFTSFPRAISDAAFLSPDPTAPFEGRMRGFNRSQTDNRRGDKLTSSEGLVIRGSYVDWRNNRVVIPPAGMFYTSRNARNVRALHGESFYVLGKKAYIASFGSTTYVRQNFDIDFWRMQPTADMNPIYWQDTILDINNKALRYSQHSWLDDRPMSMLNIVKYSGNNFGAPFLTAMGLNLKDIKHNRYAMPDMFAEGATWLIPEFIGENYMRVKEFGTPSMTYVTFTYKEPKKVVLGLGEEAKLGKYNFVVTDINQADGYSTVELRDDSGKVVANKQLGPLNAQTRALLPQMQTVVHSVQLTHDALQAEMDVLTTFEGDKVVYWLYEDIEIIERDTPLTTDPRFTARLDVCGHCYQLNEILVDNPEPIILDKKNPRFEGPKDETGNPIFTIVLDDFDGEMIQGWHIETTVKGRNFSSQNMAFYPRNNVDCLIGVNGTTEGFLRAAMMERSAYQEYWRFGHPTHPVRGLNAWFEQKFQ